MEKQLRKIVSKQTGVLQGRKVRFRTLRSMRSKRSCSFEYGTAGEVIYVMRTT